MNKSIYILLLLAGIALLGTPSCKKLPRDNPLDNKHPWDPNDKAVLTFSKYKLVYDDNHDGTINQNETIYLKVYLKNNSNSIVKHVKAGISTTSSFVSGLLPTAMVIYNSGIGPGDISPNGEKYGNYDMTPDYDYYTVKFKVAKNTPAGTRIILQMHITDEQDNEWEDSFSVYVSATGALLNYSKHVVVYDDNHDGIINQNETVYLKVYLKNKGTSKANNVKAGISTSSSFVSGLLPTTKVVYNSGIGPGDISPNGEQYGNYDMTPDYDYYTVKFKVAQNTPAGTEITLHMHITDEQGNEWEDSFTVTVN
jgi:Ca2+-binding EF-hand superfamily protein